MVIATDPDFDPGSVTMQLRLTYDGLLMSSNKPRPGHVHTIRRKFHLQLKHFWSISPWLKFAAAHKDHPDLPPRLDKIASNFSRCNHRFVPLVRREEDVLCALDILFLRSGGPGAVLNQGDIDNRLSTLFDALAIPAHCDQLGKDPKPGDGEDPFFCLMEDDSLVTQVSVDTGELLQETEAGLDGNAARVVVTVRLSPAVNLGYAKLF